MDRSPPPFFRQGPSATARLVFFALLAIILVVVDSRLQLLANLRLAVGTVLYPLQLALLKPVDAAHSAGGYLRDIDSLLSEVKTLRQQNLDLSAKQSTSREVAAENTRLRGLLDLKARIEDPSLLARVLTETRDPYTKRFIIDKGSQQGLQVGQPALDSQGLAGLITRVFPGSSEIALISDQSITLPVQLQRTGQRSIAYGVPAQNMLELRYLPGNADVKQGDVFVSSGLDSLYPAGLMVGSVERVERSGGSSFTRAWIKPSAGLDTANLVLVLLTQPTALPAEPTNQEAGRKKGRVRQ